jgi:hypothetical protein
MSAIFNTILVIIAVFSLLSTLALPIISAWRESARLKKYNTHPPKALVLEDNRGKVVVLELEKQNDAQEILRTMDVLLGK